MPATTAEAVVEVADRLFAAIEIDYLQANRAQCDFRRPEAPLLIGSAMRKGVRHPADDCFVETSSVMCKARDAAHRLITLGTPNPHPECSRIWRDK